jgi:hypothetical protein
MEYDDFRICKCMAHQYCVDTTYHFGALKRIAYLQILSAAQIEAFK